MEQLSIFSATLGLSPPWQVTSVCFGKESNRLDICVEYALGAPLTCPVCGCRAGLCSEAETETWYHDDFLHYSAYLHARLPRLTCACGVMPERPWCRAGSRFSRLAETTPETGSAPAELAAESPRNGRERWTVVPS